MQNMNSAFLAVLWLLRWQHILQEAQLMMTNPRDAFRGQSMSPSIVPFHMLGILCNSNLVFKTRRFPIFVLKNVDLEIRVRGHSRSLNAVPFDKLHTISY